MLTLRSSTGKTHKGGESWIERFIPLLHCRDAASADIILRPRRAFGKSAKVFERYKQARLADERNP